ncbi:hypothetical protein FA13DRAFT_1738281 [Coprinellus micaceus]|uniref:Uncharacterized protein n=1 Tax=Coprinellus micaceus TaxID=71717 RepID=A0A4Y7SVU1_COPMI|nr:hypothetical protein FA13DRAFT_1738281 [Coprinellus micaceus]
MASAAVFTDDNLGGLYPTNPPPVAQRSRSRKGKSGATALCTDDETAFQTQAGELGSWGTVSLPRVPMTPLTGCSPLEGVPRRLEGGAEASNRIAELVPRRRPVRMRKLVRVGSSASGEPGMRFGPCGWGTLAL